MYDTPNTERTVTKNETKFSARKVQVYYGDTHAIKFELLALRVRACTHQSSSN